MTIEESLQQEIERLRALNETLAGDQCAAIGNYAAIFDVVVAGVVVIMLRLLD